MVTESIKSIKARINSFNNVDGMPAGWIQTRATTPQLTKLHIPTFKVFTGFKESRYGYQPILVNAIRKKDAAIVDTYLTTGIKPKPKTTKLTTAQQTAKKLIADGYANQEEYSELTSLYDRNRKTHGSAYRVLVAYRRGEVEREDVENILLAMRVSRDRHMLTDYDSIDKRGLDDWEVEELRREANKTVRRTLNQGE